MELRRLLMVGAGLMSITGAAILYGAAQDEPDASKAALEQQLKDTLKSRAESAKSAYEAMGAAFNAETVTFDTFADASKKLADAEVAMATRPEEKIAALRSYVERTTQSEASIKSLFEVGTRGGEEKEYYSAKRDRESAEIMLLNARIQAK